MPPGFDTTRDAPAPAVLETDTLLLGAGPQALCLASAFLEPQPYALDDQAALVARRRHSRPGLLQVRR